MATAVKRRKVLIGISAALLGWQAVSCFGVVNPIYFASPKEVAVESFKMLLNGAIIFDISVSLYRILMSSLLALVVGVPLGIFFGYYPNIYEYVDEIVDFLRSIPPIVFYPLLLIMLGPGNVSRIGVSFIGSIVILFLIISKGLFQQASLRRDYFASMGAGKIEILKHVVWFEALPHIMTALRTSVSLSIIIIIVTEMMVGSRYGLGSRIQNVQITNNIPDLFATIVIIGFIGVVFNRCMIWVDRKLVFWKSY